MAQNNETKVQKSSTFEEWRQSSNAVSYDLGPAGSSQNKNNTIDVERALDVEPRLGDQYKTFTASAGVILHRDTANIRIDLLPDETVDNTSGYIILTGITGTGNSANQRAAEIVAGTVIQQIDAASNITFSAEVVSVSNTKVLLKNQTGTFSTASADAADIKLSTSTSKIIPHENIVRQEVGSYPKGAVRVYKKKSGVDYGGGSGNYIRLTQDASQVNGFHIPKSTHSISFTSSTSVPATYLEGEKIVQHTGNNTSNAQVFSAQILIATGSDLHGLGTNGGIILYNVDGTFDAGLDLIGTTTPAHVIDDGEYSAIATIDTTFASMIEFNTPLAVSDVIEIYYTNAVDAILELQDDIGTVESLSNASLGNNADAPTDLVTAINNIKTFIGTTAINTVYDLGDADTITAAISNLHAEIGTSTLTDNLPSDVTYTVTDHTTATNTLTAFVGNSSIANIGSTDTLTGALQSLHAEIGDVTALTGTASTSAFGFDTEVLTTALVELRTLVCPGDIDSGVTALSANVGNADNFAATTNTDGIIELQTIVGNRTGLSNGNLGNTSAGTNDIVAQINFIKSFIGTTTLVGIDDNGADANTITEAISNLHAEIGTATISQADLGNIDDTPSDLTAAINTIKAFIGIVGIDSIGGANTITSAVAQLFTDIGDVGGSGATLAAATGFSATNLTGAVTEIQADIGNAADISNATGYSAASAVTGITEIQALLGDITSLTGSNDFQTATVLDSLLELKTAISGSDDLTDTVAELVSGSSTDFDATSIVDAIKLVMLDIGKLSDLSSTPFAADANIEGSYTPTDLVTIIDSYGEYIGSTNISAIGSDNTITTAISTLHDEIGSSNISTVSGTDNTITTAINQLHHEIGDVAGSNTRLGIGTDRTIATSSSVASPNSGVILNLVNTLNLVPGMRVTGTGITAAATIVSVDSGNNRVTLSAGGITTSITTGSPVNITFRAETLQVKALALDTNTGNVSAIADATGYSATNLVGGLTEIQGKIGEVSATNMGTTASTAVTAINELATTKLAIGADAAAMKTAMGTDSSTVTAAIKELVDGTGAATVSVKGQGSVQPTGKLDNISATKQTVIGDIDFNSSNPSGAASFQSVLKFGANTVLDLSDSGATLKLSAAATGTSISNVAFLALAGVSGDPIPSTGVGLEIQRANINNVQESTSTNVQFKWVDDQAEIDGDLSWQVSGLTENGNSPYTAANLDFYNVGRLFAAGGKLNTASQTASSHTGISATWDTTNQNFDLALTADPTVALTGPITGSVALTNLATSTFNLATTITNDAVILGTHTTGDYIETATGTSNEIAITGAGTEGRDIVIGLPTNVTVGGNTTLAGNNTASGTITLGGTNTTTTVAGQLTVNNFTVTGTNTQTTVSNTTLTGDALVLRAENTGVPGNTDTPKFVVHRGFGASKAHNALEIGKRYKITSAGIDSAATTFDFTDAGAANNNVNTIFTATATTTGGTGGTALIQSNEAAIVWNEVNDQFTLTRAGTSGAVSTNTTTGSIIAQGDTIGAATLFTAALNTDNEDKQIPFVDVTSTTSPLQRDGGLLYNPSTNALKILEGNRATIIDNDGNSFHNDILIKDSENDGTGIRKLTIEGGHASLRLKESGVTGTPEWYTIADSGNFSVKLNNAGQDALRFNTNEANNAITLAYIGYNAQVNGSITGTSLVSSGGVTAGTTIAVPHTGQGFSAGAAGHTVTLQNNGTKSILHSANDHLLVRSNQIELQTAGQELYFLATANGAATVYHDNVAKLATTSDGIKVTGEIETTTGANIAGNLVIGTFAAAQDTDHGATSSFSLAAASPLHIIKRAVTSGDNALGGDNVLATFEVNGYDYVNNPGKISIDFKGQDLNNTVNFARISQATVNDTDYGYDTVHNEATSNLIFGATLDGNYGEHHIMTGSGRLGVGMLNPTVTLDVDGTAKASSFRVTRSTASTIQIDDNATDNGTNTKAVLSNSGIPLLAQSSALGSTQGDTTTQAEFRARNANTSFLRILDKRMTTVATPTWNSAYKAIQFGTDATDQAYIAANKNNDYGLEFGNATNDQPWIKMYPQGRVDINYNTTTRLATTSTGAAVTGVLTSTLGHRIASVDSGSLIQNRWYTIAVIGGQSSLGAANTGQRAAGTFEVSSPQGNSHFHMKFIATHLYAANSTINVLSQSQFSSASGSITGIRIKENSTYDGAALQIFVGNTRTLTEIRFDQTADAFKEDNKGGWTLITPEYDDGSSYVPSEVDATAAEFANWNTDVIVNMGVNRNSGNTASGSMSQNDNADMFLSGGLAARALYLNNAHSTDWSYIANSQSGVNSTLDFVVGDDTGSGGDRMRFQHSPSNATQFSMAELYATSNTAATLSVTGTIIASDDITLSGTGKKFKAAGNGSFTTMYHDGSGGHIDANGALELTSPSITLQGTAGANKILSGDTNGTKIYHNNTSIVETASGGINVNGSGGVLAQRFTFPFIPDLPAAGGATTGRGIAQGDQAFIECNKLANNSTAFDFVIGDDVGGHDKFRFRFNSWQSDIAAGAIFSLAEMYPGPKGCTILDLTVSDDLFTDGGADDALDNVSEVRASKFVGTLTGTATGLSATLPVSGGGTGSTAFSDRSVIVSQDSSTDTLSAKEMTASGQLLIGGASGPEVGTLGAGEGIVITVGDGSISISAETATSSNLGIAKFSTNDFDVATGSVSIKADGITTAQIADDAVTFAKMQEIATDTIMGRTADGNGNASALSKAEAQGILNVADGADNFAKIRIKTASDGTGTGEEVGSNEDITILAAHSGNSGATSVTRVGRVITVASSDNNTTYNADGFATSTSSTGLYLAGNTFKLTPTIRPYVTQVIGTTTNTSIRMSGTGGSSVNGAPLGSMQFFNEGFENMRLEPSRDSLASPGVGLEVNGDITAFSTSLSSDIKLKENIVVVNNALEKVSKLNGVTFDWKKNGKASAGVIAQNVEEVMPELVNEATGLNNTESHKVVDYNGLSSLFIEAIKELKDQNELLRAEIEELKANK